MPGPVSDSFDPEFGTGANAQMVREGIEEIVNTATGLLGSELHNILEIVDGPAGEQLGRRLRERDWRIIRFALNRALESL